MIAKGHSVSYGANSINYISGASNRKEHPEDIHFICSHGLEQYLDAAGIWSAMDMHAQSHKKMKNSICAFELCPPKNYVANFTRKDWEELEHEFFEIYDNLELTNEETGHIYAPKTSFSNSMRVAFLHLESKGGKPHLHIAASNVDLDGKAINNKYTRKKSAMAGEILARRRGWTTARDVRANNIAKVIEDCKDVLRSMDEFDVMTYLRLLESRKGYKIDYRRDSEGKLHGYSIRKGKAKYNASDLKPGRHFTVKELERTWQQLRNEMRKNVASAPKPTDTAKSKTSSSPRRTEVQQPNTLKRNEPPSWKPTKDYFINRPYHTLCRFEHEGKNYRCYIPDAVDRFLDDEMFDYRYVLNCDALKALTLALFVGIIGPTEVAPSVGGGGSDNGGWRDPKDEDELERARRCANLAIAKIGKQVRTGYRRKG